MPKDPGPRRAWQTFTANTDISLQIRDNLCKDARTPGECPPESPLALQVNRGNEGSETAMASKAPQRFHSMLSRMRRIHGLVTSIVTGLRVE